MPHCAVVNCKNSSKNASRDNGNISFHVFPSIPSIKNKWIEATGQKDWSPTKYSKICSVHFDYGCFMDTKNYRRLTTKAIPTIDVLKTSTNEHNNKINQKQEDSQPETPLKSPKKNKIEHKLNLAREKIIKQNKHIKRLREQNRRKDLKILKLVAVIERLKNEMFSKEDIKIDRLDIDPHVTCPIVILKEDDNVE